MWARAKRLYVRIRTEGTRLPAYQGISTDRAHEATTHPTNPDLLLVTDTEGFPVIASWRHFEWLGEVPA